MKYFLLAFVLFLAVSCTDNKPKNEGNGINISPEAGTAYPLGREIQVIISGNSGLALDSVVYLVDDQRIIAKSDTSSVSIPTTDLTLGSKIITARIFRQGQSEDVTTNVILLPHLAAEKYTYQVVKVYPHDEHAYTQGLEYHDGFLYESAGEYGQSNLRKVELPTGKVLQQVSLSPEQFAEGITLVGDKIVQLTWREGMGLVYNLADFKSIGSFAYQASAEGWGLCFDGKQLWKSDGSNRLWRLNKDSYVEEGFIEVYNTEGPIQQLNELEYIDGKIYANVYQSDEIVIIDPATGAVTGQVDMRGLLPAIDHHADTDVLNGIAWDAKGKRLFVTGKRWNKLFEIKIIPDK